MIRSEEEIKLRDTKILKYFIDENKVLNRVRIVKDVNALDPRESLTNLCHMAFWKYDLGDESYWYSEFEELEKDEVEYLPLNLYHYPGRLLYTKYLWYRKPDEGGQCGWIYVKKDEAMEYNPDLTEDNWREYARIRMNKEVDIYDMYLREQVYGVVVEKYDKSGLVGRWKEKDNCYGCFCVDYGDGELFTNVIKQSDIVLKHPLYDKLEELEQEVKL